jgi:hypothetical protein
MLDFLLDVTIDYDHGKTPFMTPHFGTFVRKFLLLLDFQIGEYFGTNLRSMFPS